MEKITKKKDINKDKINEILEKYNLKAPKKTQVNDKKQKKEEQIINVIKSSTDSKYTKPITVQQIHEAQPRPKSPQVERPLSPKATRPKSPQIEIKEIQQQTQQQRPKSPQVNIQRPQPQIQIQRPQIQSQQAHQQPQQPRPQLQTQQQRPKSPQVNIQRPQPQIQRPQPTQPQIPQSIPTNTQKTISINSLLKKDNQEMLNNKNTIPQAIISNNNPKDFLNNNIYNIIPKINPQKQYSHLDTSKAKQQRQKQSERVKTISINPNLSEDASQTYQGSLQSQQNKKQVEKVEQVEYIEQEEQDILPQQKSRYRIVKRQRANTDQNSDNSNDNDNDNSNDTSNDNDNGNSSLNNLELQRQYLQEQQRKELAKLKFKKDQIMKIHNRKKEIELMKSIETEKQKLRLLQNKQQDLNKLIQSQEIMNTHPEQNIQEQNKIININTATTLKNKHQIYNVDEKKTKKNMSLIKDVKDVIDVIKQPSIITRVKSSIKDVPIIKDVDTSTVSSTSSSTVSSTGSSTIIEPKETEKELTILEPVIIKTNKKHTSSTNTINTDEQYKYYYKKDIKKHKLDVNWGTQEELYNRENMTEQLTLLLNIQPLFTTIVIKTIKKDIRSLEEKIKILQSVYYFKNIKKIKDSVIELIYNILVCDNIIDII